MIACKPDRNDIKNDTKAYTHSVYRLMMQKNVQNIRNFKDSDYLSAPFIGIRRHRLNSDGNGVTALVGFHGCPLRCKYCLNSQSTSKERIWKTLTTQQLYEIVKVDDLYFRSTNGGIIFGGGEPALYAEFINEFRGLCGNKWKITLETSLNIETAKLEMLSPIADCFIIDIKDINNNIYAKYTSRNNSIVIENLKYLAKNSDAHIQIKIPLIPEYNTNEDRAISTDYINSLDFKQPIDIKCVDYKTDVNKDDYE